MAECILGRVGLTAQRNRIKGKYVFKAFCDYFAVTLSNYKCNLRRLVSKFEVVSKATALTLNTAKCIFAVV